MSNRRSMAVFGSALSGFSFGGGVELFFRIEPGPPVLLAGLGAGVGVGILVAALIPDDRGTYPPVAAPERD